ncbi:E3 ubiquitin-protein ligase FANCL [Fukomys damarensis]|uniref:E3 ubiquitin-protein ligase FANCL n=1 Tax=Fukomys damarensis TaxID=885580 RepID=A0A091D6K9_FUKDA|nr:E3 ubiquitin-protein ligase FANCL [Fukomys damarensis]
MAANEVDLLRQFPLLLPQNRKKTVYEGFISAQEVALKNRQELCVLPLSSQFYSVLIEDIETLGWDKIVYVDACFSTIKLKAEDASGREHLITVKLKAKHPAESPDCFVDFPVPFSVSWTPQSSLISIHSQFLAALESLKAFWDVMDEIDEKTWVLEPQKPTRSATARRIALVIDFHIRTKF